MSNQANIHSPAQEDSQQIMLSLDIDNFEIESFVTGVNDYERDAINKGADISCTYPTNGSTTAAIVE